MSFLNLSGATRYKLAGQVKGHTDSVHSLAMARGGRFLASGGSDGIRLWDVKTHAQFPTPNQHHVQHGQVSTALWLAHTNDTSEMLCYGTGLGYIVFWGQRQKRVSTSLQSSCSLS